MRLMTDTQRRLSAQQITRCRFGASQIPIQSHLVCTSRAALKPINQKNLSHMVGEKQNSCELSSNYILPIIDIPYLPFLKVIKRTLDDFCPPPYMLQVHSYRNRVLFTSAMAAIPSDAVLVEIGPHSVLRSPLRQGRPELGYVALMQKGNCGLSSLSRAVGDLWLKGAALHWPAEEAASGIKGAECEEIQAYLSF